jgi:uncharacterized membrane protein
MTVPEPPQPAPPPAPRPINGRKVVIALLVGVAIGWCIGVFLESIVANTPNTIDPQELRWLRKLVGAAGGLAGLAIEAIRQLQAANPDPAYHRRSRLKR